MTDPGFYDWTPTHYHTDPCDVPSLSSSVAKVLVSKNSALHAYDCHPRLGGAKQDSTKSGDNGSLYHALLLGVGEIVEIDAADYRTKVAQTERDAAYARGATPVLAHKLEEARAVAETLRVRLADFGVTLSGRCEQAMVWHEQTAHGVVVCRGMMDAFDEECATIVDLKTIVSADIDAANSHIYKYGYDIQREAYIRGVEQLCPHLVGRIDWIWAFVETSSPYAVLPMRAGGRVRELGKLRWERGVNMWAKCMAENKWPGPVQAIAEADVSGWAFAREFGAELERDDADV